MSDHDVEFTVLMPCLNEAETLVTCIRKARACVERLGLSAEIVVADNGSTDASKDMALAEGARLVHVPIRGYGAALYHGLQASRGRYIIMGDADDSYDFSRLDAFVDELRGGADLVMGNRFAGGILPGAMPWKNRYLGNPLLSWLGRLFFHTTVRDFHCGLRGLARRAFERLDLQTTGMEFASEMVIKAALTGLHVVEVPTTLQKDGRNRRPHLRPWRDGWRHLRFMLLYCPRWLFLYPGTALLVAGLTFILRMLWGLTQGDLAGVGPLQLVVASVAVLLGFQGVAFAFCARIYALLEGFLPRDPDLERMFTWLKLETGLVAGMVFLLAGVSGGVYSLLDQPVAGLKPLSSDGRLLVAISAATAICIGGQIVFTSFLLSIIGLGVRPRSGGARPSGS